MTRPVVIVEPSPDTPLVWFEIAIRGGAALDPPGIEGLHRHAALLARRGAGGRDRAALDDTLDGLGAALDISVSRDAVTASLSSDGSRNGVSWASTDDAASPSITSRRYSRADGQPASKVATISSVAQSGSSWPGAL